MANAPQNYAAISLRGEAVLGFLNNILTCELEALNQGEVAFGALLSPQGKILHAVFVIAQLGGADIVCAADQCEALLTKLKLYRLRARIDIAELAEVPSFKDPRHDGLQEDNRFDLGIASLAEIGSAKFFPHEANFDLLNGVSFTKGCYVGQEVVSRMQHRGLVKSRILPVTFENDQYADEFSLGQIIAKRGNKALALVRLDRLEEQGAPQGVVISKPDWMTK